MIFTWVLKLPRLAAATFLLLDTSWSGVACSESGDAKKLDLDELWVKGASTSTDWLPIGSSRSEVESRSGSPPPRTPRSMAFIWKSVGDENEVKRTSRCHYRSKVRMRFHNRVLRIKLVCFFVQLKRNSFLCLTRKCEICTNQVYASVFVRGYKSLQTTAVYLQKRLQQLDLLTLV